jgi:DNA-binding transcriptional LysR family regulator
MVMSDPIANWQSRIGRRLSLRDLHILLAVVQWGSMAKAAAHLAISQPAISKAIADLERAVGVRLLDRSPGGIEPTPFGRALVKRGLAVFDELRQGINEIEFLADPTTGEVRVGCPESIAAGLLPGVVERFSQDYPRMVLRVTQAQTVTLEFRELRERNVDLMIGRVARPFVEEGLSAEILFDEPLYVVAGIQSRWARRRKLSLAELIHERWILTPPNEVLSSPIADAFHAQGLETPQAAVVSFSFHLRNYLLANTDFLSLIPASMLRLFNARQTVLKALPVDATIAPLPVAIITLKNRLPTPEVQLFIGCAREVAKTITKTPEFRTVPSRRAARNKRRD